jgi:hypothetical protein
MNSYASGTKVSEAKSHFELQQLFKKFGCEGTGYMEHEDETRLMFAKDGVTYKFTLRFPDGESQIKVGSNYRPGTHGSKLDYERARKMRALVMIVKAQLVAIEEGIATWDDMFIGQTVTDNGQTIAERWGPQVTQKCLEGVYPSVLPGRTA